MKKFIGILCLFIMSVLVNADILDSIKDRYDYCGQMTHRHVSVLHTVYSADFIDDENPYSARFTTDDYMDSLSITTVYYFPDINDSLITRSVIRQDNPAASYISGRKQSGLMFSPDNIYRGHDIESLIDSAAEIITDDSIITIVNKNNAVDSLFLDRDSYCPVKIVMSTEGAVLSVIMSDYHTVTDYLQIPGSMDIYMNNELTGRSVLEETETEFHNE
ncbi:MAG: hypothetical protein R6U31_02745 [bacterium]